MKDLRDMYFEDIIKYLEDEVKKLRELKVKKRFFWTRNDEEKLEKMENLLIEKYEKIGNMLDD